MKNILVVDDNRLVTEVLAVSLNQVVKDCRVLTAANGADAVNVLSGTEMDLVLTDLQMPVMSGYELIKYCREHHLRLLLAAMTGDCSPDVLKRLHALDVFVCFEKPFDYDQVAQQVRDELDQAAVSPAGIFHEAPQRPLRTRLKMFRR